MEPTVVVIGGGYGGSSAAKALDAVADVVLVEPKDAFFHSIGALRAMCGWSLRRKGADLMIDRFSQIYGPAGD
jgi:flavin-dependent dehydrogenase